MHSLLSLQSAEEAGASVTAATATRQALILMFLSLPVFQDPAPWNVVWRAGELFPIDVGDGTTLEERGGDWNTFAQKYIGSLNECYRMSLKWLCMFANSDNGMHGDEKYEACMSSHFGASFCPPNNPFPCVTGCNRSYQACPHLPPRKVTPGYFIRNNVHTRNGKVAARASRSGATTTSSKRRMRPRRAHRMAAAAAMAALAECRAVWCPTASGLVRSTCL